MQLPDKPLNEIFKAGDEIWDNWAGDFISKSTVLKVTAKQLVIKEQPGRGCYGSVWTLKREDVVKRLFLDLKDYTRQKIVRIEDEIAAYRSRIEKSKAEILKLKEELGEEV